MSQLRPEGDLPASASAGPTLLSRQTEEVKIAFATHPEPESMVTPEPSRSPESDFEGAHWQLRRAVFQQLCKYIRRKKSLPESSFVINQAKSITRRLYHTHMLGVNSFRSSEEANQFVAKTATDVAAFLLATYDPTKVRPAPRSTRADRFARNELIVARYRETGDSIANLAVYFNLSKKIITDTLHNAGVRPRRYLVVNNLTAAGSCLLGLLDDVVPMNRMMLLHTSEIAKYITNITNEKAVDIDQVVSLLSNKGYGISAAMADHHVVVSKGRRKTPEELLLFATQALDPNQNLRIHHVLQIGDYYFRKSMSSFSYLIKCLRELCEISPLYIIEALWFRSFKYKDPERVRMILCRALNTEGRLHSVENFLRWETNDVDLIRRSVGLSVACAGINASNNPSLAVYTWLVESDLKTNLDKDDENDYHHILNESENRKEFDEFDKFISEFILIKSRFPLSTGIKSARFDVIDFEGDRCDDYADESVDDRRTLDLELGDELGPPSFDPHDC